MMALGEQIDRSDQTAGWSEQREPVQQLCRRLSLVECSLREQKDEDIPEAATGGFTGATGAVAAGIKLARESQEVMGTGE